jgi:hypothetical protein
LFYKGAKSRTKIEYLVRINGLKESVVMQFTSDNHFQEWLKKGRILAYEGTDGRRRMITSLDEATSAGSGEGGGLLELFERLEIITEPRTIFIKAIKTGDDASVEDKEFSLGSEDSIIQNWNGRIVLKKAKDETSITDDSAKGASTVCTNSRALTMPEPAKSPGRERGSTSRPVKQGKLISYKFINDLSGEVEFKKAKFDSDSAFQHWLRFNSGNTLCNLLEDGTEHYIDSLEGAVAACSDSSKTLLCLLNLTTSSQDIINLKNAVSNGSSGLEKRTTETVWIDQANDTKF